MTAKMPMSGSPEKRRDCIAELPLRVAYFYAGVKLRQYGDSPSATTAQLGMLRAPQNREGTTFPSNPVRRDISIRCRAFTLLGILVMPLAESPASAVCFLQYPSPEAARRSSRKVSNLFRPDRGRQETGMAQAEG